MLINKNIILNRNGKKSMLVDTFHQENVPNQPIVLFCHGYKGFKDWGAWSLMGEKIAEAGNCFVKFNFSHNGGTIENPIDFPDLEAFGNNNYSIELDDLNDVISWVIKHFKSNPKIDCSRITLIGHSRGGGITILKASEDKRVTKLITLASVSDFGRRTATTGDLEEWRAKGVKYVVNGRTKQQMPHYYQFYEDFKANKEHLHIESAAKQIEIPMLIIHGDKDTSVSINEGYELHQWNPNSEVNIIKGADHVFNVKHPWASNQLSTELEAVVASIITFVK